MISCKLQDLYLKMVQIRLGAHCVGELVRWVDFALIPFQNRDLRIQNRLTSHYEGFGSK